MRGKGGKAGEEEKGRRKRGVEKECVNVCALEGESYRVGNQVSVDVTHSLPLLNL